MTWKKKRRYPMAFTGPAWSGGIGCDVDRMISEDPQINSDHLPMSQDQFGGAPAPAPGHVDAGDH